jgi:hypothetical protein
MAQINKPSEYFNTKLYTGNGSTQSITGVGFQPDWTWFKRRNGTDTHAVFDNVRGVQQRLIPNNTSAEGTQSNGLTSFDSDGFSIGDAGICNTSGGTYASWNWLANGAGVSNTDGSITSTVSANTTSGFSIVTFTSTGSTSTIGHGLRFSTSHDYLGKRRDSTSTWTVGHQSLGWTKFLRLNTTAVGTKQVGGIILIQHLLYLLMAQIGVLELGWHTASLRKRDLASLVLTQVMVMLMVRLCTQDLNLLLLCQNHILILNHG